MYLQHVHGLSDEAVVARWVENPYFQHFTGETFFQHCAPIHPSSLSRWRDRIGEEGAEWLLTKNEEGRERPLRGVSPTNEAGRASGAVAGDSLKRIAVDTTVMDWRGTVAPVGPRKSPEQHRASDRCPAL